MTLEELKKVNYALGLAIPVNKRQAVAFWFATQIIEHEIKTICQHTKTEVAFDGHVECVDCGEEF